MLVLGAGLAGLAVAARLVDADREAVVLESSPRAGGQIHTFAEGELVVELGAEGFVARSQAVPNLCRRLGLEPALIGQLTTDTHCLEQGKLVLLPPGEAARRLGFQVPEEELGRGIRSLSRGMAQLTDALLARLGSARVRLATPVTAIRRAASELEVTLASGERLGCARLVVATPARVAAGLLEPLGLEATAPLASASTLSNVSVNLLYRSEQLGELPRGSGLLFPEAFARIGLRAMSLVHQKFAGRAPAGAALLRVFFRPDPEALQSWDDARFAQEAHGAIARVLPVSGLPRQSWVSRWAFTLPVFSAAYREQVAAAEQALEPLGIELTGSAFHGAGIDAAAASAERVAARLCA